VARSRSIAHVAKAAAYAAPVVAAVKTLSFPLKEANRYYASNEEPTDVNRGDGRLMLGRDGLDYAHSVRNGLVKRRKDKNKEDEEHCGEIKSPKPGEELGLEKGLESLHRPTERPFDDRSHSQE